MIKAQKFTVGNAIKHLIVLTFVVLWTLPTAGLLVSSVRDADQLIVSGWWTALVPTERNEAHRTQSADAQVEENGMFRIDGQLFREGSGRSVVAWGTGPRTLEEYEPGGTWERDDGSRITIESDGSYTWLSDEPFEHTRGIRLFYIAAIPPRFTLANYERVLEAEGIGRAFINSVTVTLPATFIPILIAAFAAYALSWMTFWGRTFFLAAIVGLLVVPLQMALIPVLSTYNWLGQTWISSLGWEPRSYLGIWLAHTGFGLPLAVYLLRNYMVGLPKEIMESARMDGATHFKIFISIVLPLSIPALASFAIFQFLWVWNDLLVAIVFLGQGEGRTVLTAQLRELLGSRGDNWEILTAGAFITMIVPLVVFISMQRYFVRGMLAGSVKGG
ncbi:carbohydrate ABC transporter permease [Natronospirillum operosum]|uniref:Carbohydrate ABC transporter permease n=1 Tax=Natronospirillum operosum TaxID=2759953 RepID=A0A4Z0W5S0_9GAMM|nr:carbohydrate ABC transporter permease [Natronospirillum operosum]TGG91344.1 carbohydrate ABC transporter permease [Natronospirillum operosum]